MPFPRLAALTAAALAVAVLATAACSGDDGGDAVPGVGGPSLGEIQPQPEPVQEGGDLVEPRDGLIEVHISGARFLQNELGMTAGEPVKSRRRQTGPATLIVCCPDQRTGWSSPLSIGAQSPAA